MCCERNVYARIGRGAGTDTSRILCYHSIGTPEWGVNDVSPKRFARHIELALEEGRRFVPASVIARGEGAPKDLAVTFDDGLMSVWNAVPVLDSYRVPYTLFIVSDWADGNAPWADDDLFLGWGDVTKLAARGATIASHSVTHPNFGQLSLEQGVHEMSESRAAIAKKLAMAPAEFAIPFGQSKDWGGKLSQAAAALGYDVVYAQSEARRSPGTVGRTFVTKYDNDTVFRGALHGRFDKWEEWV
jgi:peptidoglycan/xylan/chitin deacetylase (PgdA/CDA1 family)